MARYLVTGGAGFIGSNIARSLLDQGEEVVALDNLITGRMENLAGLNGRLTFIEGDVREAATVREAMDGVDFVLHQAALPSVPRSISNPVLTTDINVGGTLNVLVAAREAGVKRLVCASSSSVYGNSPKLPRHEEMTPDPASPYAVSKLAQELYCRVFHNLYGLQTVMLRYFNVFGPHQSPKSEYAAVIPKFIDLMLRGESPVVYGDGYQSRDFTYVDNVVSANILATRAPGVSGMVFNVGCGERYTLSELVNALNSILGTNIEPRFAPLRPGDVRESLADISRASSHLGYEAETSFLDGLARTVNWFTNHDQAEH
ncbi:MAG: SDR family oxidoreductase [Chloroflexi bacterium]|nr:SDR family oxidoreductase [Chloroflexota bacterium]